MRLKNRIIAVTPIICLIAYLAIGFYAHIWHPTWAIFFLIIIVPVMLNDNIGKIIYPIICVALYITAGIVLGWWATAWIIFLTIPVYYTLIHPYLFRKKKTVKVVEE